MINAILIDISVDFTNVTFFFFFTTERKITAHMIAGNDRIRHIKRAQQFLTCAFCFSVIMSN
ncbi:hypothetical protein BKD02_15915 [Brucella sp. 09RB8910]|nr:hypothetical protein BKD02_15915 [Brucella sp. 09RB8910]